MKKITTLVVLALLLTACGSSSEPEKIGEAKTEVDAKGDFASAKITMNGNKVKSISLDQTKEKKSKKELGASYNMKSQSKIGKEWDEQVTFLENYIVKNGLDKVQINKEGIPTGNDVLAGCTMDIKLLMEAANKAKENAK